MGGYVAAAAAAPALDAGRTAIGALTGMTASDVIFTTGSNHALDLLLSSWTGPRTVACLPGEYGPNLALFAANDFDVRVLPVDGDRPVGRRRRRHGPGRRSARVGAPDPAGQPPGNRPARPRARRGVPRPGLAIGDRRRAGFRAHRLCGRRGRGLFVVAQVDCRSARGGHARDQTRPGAESSATVATAGMESAIHRAGKPRARGNQPRCAHWFFGSAWREPCDGPGEHPRQVVRARAIDQRPPLRISTAGGSSRRSTRRRRSPRCGRPRGRTRRVFGPG